MKKTFALCILFVMCLSCAGVSAQMSVDDFIAVSIAQTELGRKAVVAANIELSEEESTLFWPIYDNYRNNAKKSNERLYRLIEKYATNYASLSDAIANEILTEAMDLTSQQAEYLRVYVDALKEIFPARKVAKLYQVENKMDALTRAELALEIPFVRASEDTAIAVN